MPPGGTDCYRLFHYTPLSTHLSTHPLNTPLNTSTQHTSQHPLSTHSNVSLSFSPLVALFIDSVADLTRHNLMYAQDMLR